MEDETMKAYLSLITFALAITQCIQYAEIQSLKAKLEAIENIHISITVEHKQPAQGKVAMNDSN